MASIIHAVSKHDNAQNATFTLTTPPPPLGPSSVRVHTTLITLSSNNLTYARLGTPLAWWTAYPIPPTAPPPYADPSSWGIVPAWGYATILESTLPSLPPNTHLWGYWPTTSHPTTLQLRAAPAPADHWIETSPHRQALMPLYNRYVHTGPHPPTDAAIAFKPVWECGYLLARHVFPATSEIAPVHPLGAPGGTWSPQDADLRNAVVVALSASSKTARAFAWQLRRNRDVASGGPLALLQVTSAPEALKRYEDGEAAAALPASKAVAYADVAAPATLAWVAGFAPERVVVVDFGAAEAVAEGFLAAVGAAGEVEGGFKPRVTVVACGGEMKVYSAEDMKRVEESMVHLGKVLLNTSGVRDVAIEAEGPEEYFKNMNEAWERCEREEGMGEFEMVRLVGVESVERVWRDLCRQKVRPNQAILVRV